jgi:hypothetical protein
MIAFTRDDTDLHEQNRRSITKSPKTWMTKRVNEVLQGLSISYHRSIIVDQLPPIAQYHANDYDSTIRVPKNEYRVLRYVVSHDNKI